jgi:hypothetical protein
MTSDHSETAAQFCRLSRPIGTQVTLKLTIYGARDKLPRERKGKLRRACRLVEHLAGRPGAGRAYSSPVTNRLQDVLCPGLAHCGPAWWVVWGLGVRDSWLPD